MDISRIDVIKILSVSVSLVYRNKKFSSINNKHFLTNLWTIENNLKNRLKDYLGLRMKIKTIILLK